MRAFSFHAMVVALEGTPATARKAGIGELRRVGSPGAAQHLGITASELKSLRKAKRIPFYRIGHRTVSYALTDLDAFLAGCRVATADERRLGRGR
jgi:hypothetical protein